MARQNVKAALSLQAEPATLPADLIRLTTRVAQMYHEDKLGQSEIAAQLGLSQARVSRLLKQAEAIGIVRTTVHVPPGVHSDAEHMLERLYDLDEVIVVELGDSAYESEEALNLGLSAATAAWLELMLPTFRSVGISSWSSTLLAAVNSMRPMRAGNTKEIIQVLGGLGQASSQIFATRLTERLAGLAGAEANFLLAPGVAGNLDAHSAMMADPACSHTISRFDSLSAILMGIGSLPPSRMLRKSGNVFSDAVIRDLKERGAVGDVCMRFYDKNGQSVQSEFDRHVIGIESAQILNTRRRLGVAAGPKKFNAIRGALRGGWITTLITDLKTAEKLARRP